MKTYLRFLWKEWRDHRALVLGIAISVPLLLLLAHFLIPSKFANDPILSQFGAWGTLALVTLSFASDLVPGEVRRGRIGFLARMPAGLGAPYAAKMTFLLIALLFAPVYGFATGALFSGWHTDRWELVVGPGLLVLCAAPWLFAVSCWLPRGALTLPATALVLALFALPIYLLFLFNPGFKPVPADLVGTALGLAAGAFVVAWFSFTRGLRHGGGALAAGWRGLLATLVLFTPVYAYGGYRVYEWNTIDPFASPFTITQAQVGEGDRVLFLNTQMILRQGRTTAYHGLIVDTHDGSWRPTGHGFERLEWASVQDFTPVRVVPALRAGTVERDERDPTQTKHWMDYYDARTGEWFKSAWSNDLPAEVLKRATEGRAAWERGFLRMRTAGMGHMVLPEGRRMRPPGFFYADRVRRKLYPVPSRGTRGSGWHAMIARQGWWFWGHDGVVLRDPETGEEETRSLPGRPVDVWEDGRLVLLRARGKEQGVPQSNLALLYDPETNEECVLDLDEAQFLSRLGHGCVLAWSDEQYIVFRVDAETGECAEIVRGVTSVIAVNEERILAIEDGKRVVHIDRNSNAKTVLFPK